MRAGWRGRYRQNVCHQAASLYGARLEPVDVAGLTAVIRLGLGREFGRKGSRRTLFVTTLDGKKLPVVYSEVKRAIVSVLAPHDKEVLAAKVKKLRKCGAHALLKARSAA